MKNVMYINNISLYLYFLNKRNSYDNLKLYWSQYFYNMSYIYNYSHVSMYNCKISTSIFDNTLNYSCNKNTLIKPCLMRFKNNCFPNYLVFYLRACFTRNYVFFNHCFATDTETLSFSRKFLKYYTTYPSLVYFNKNIYKFFSSEFLENFRYVKSYTFFANKPINFSKNLNNTNEPITLNITFKNKNIFVKDNLILYFLVIKQKRYVPKQIVSNESITSSKKLNFIINFQKFFFYQTTHNLVHNYFIKYLRSYNNILNLTLNKRLLRTKRLLVLPAHFNISVITNSFDVVHS